MLYNPRSLNNNVSEVMMYMQDRHIDIAGICESWLTGTNTPTTATIKRYGYKIIYTFRHDKMGGGTAILYKSHLSLSKVTFSTIVKTFEYTAALSKTIKSSKILFVIIYRSIQHQNLYLKLMHLLLKLSSNVIV